MNRFIVGISRAENGLIVENERYDDISQRSTDAYRVKRWVFGDVKEMTTFLQDKLNMYIETFDNPPVEAMGTDD